MSKYIPGNQKHLSLDDRKYIEKSLNQGLSFKETESVAAFYFRKCQTRDFNIRGFWVSINL